MTISKQSNSTLLSGDSLILDISEDTSIGQTLKLPSVTNQSGDIQKVKEDSFQQSGFDLEDKANEFVPGYSAAQSNLLLSLI